MKEIKLTIPEGCKTVTVKVDGEQVITEFEPKDSKFDPKDGDILYGGSIAECIIIYKGTGEQGEVLSYAGLIPPFKKLSIFKEPDIVFGCTIDYTRYATEEEKQRLFDALAKEGKRWNAEKKQIEDLPRWRAEKGNIYYYISENRLEVDCTSDSHGLCDDNYYNARNYFKTKEAAEHVAKQIREIFNKSKAE